MTQSKKRIVWILCGLLGIGLITIYVYRADRSDASVLAGGDHSQIEAEASERPVLHIPIVDSLLGILDAILDFVFGNKAKVVFPDGEVITVTLRPQPRSSSRKPSALADEYDDLSEAARNGDPIAAFDLAEWLRMCTHSVDARTRPELDAVIEQVIKTHQYPMRIMSYGAEHRTVMSTTTSIVSTIEDLTREFEFCEGVTDEQIMSFVDWYQLAAANGHVSAGYKVGEWLANRGLDRDTSEELLLQSWNRGYMQSAAALSKFYSRPYGTVPPDQKREYAYLFLYSQLLKADDSIQPQLAERWFPSVVEGVHNASAKLSPHDLSEAQDLAKTLLTQHPNCCYSFFNYSDLSQ